MNTTKVTNPLGAHLQRYHDHLERQFYRRQTVRFYDRCIRELNNKMAEFRVGVESLDEDKALELIAKSDLPACNAQHRQFVVRSFVKYLVGLGVAKPTPKPVPATEREQLRHAYEEYLLRERGLSERTIYSCWRIADRFLTFRFGANLGDLNEITAVDIARFLQHRATLKPPRDKTLSTHPRNFFRYLFKAAKIKTNLAESLLSVAQRHGARLPRHLSPEQVDTLLKAIRRDKSSGRRDYAMVLLIARLGLRAPEVIAIQLDDLDWRSGEIIVRGKGKRYDRVPLPQDVGEALTDYIKQERTTVSRTLFVTGRPPHPPFKNAQVLNNILRNAYARTGLKPPVPWVGSHILRHSLATNLVAKGASLEEIGDMLRHRCRASTLIYAKLDIEGLRSIAQPWPVVGGAR